MRQGECGVEEGDASAPRDLKALVRTEGAGQRATYLSPEIVLERHEVCASGRC
ncbi:hypothetical protein E2C01_101300 [Portunus trituberculatus]|uniref:Uncharacterized protein n=1 Tax=Portunus trituberculatus TaxID=210409 RepID=A0A5B7K985_PORTR|nr:hypothetical protein [Portunus trituberculatus]